MSLKTKLIIGVLSTMILIIAACSGFTFISVNLFSENGRELTNGLSNDAQRDVSGFAEHYAGTLTYHETKNVKASINGIISSAKSDLATVASFNEVYSDNPEELVLLFEKIAKENKLISNMYLGTEDKEFIIYPNDYNLPDDYDPTVRPWYAPIKESGEQEYLITDAYLDAGTDIYMVTVSLPLYINNQLYGVLGADISLEKLTASIADTKVGETGYVILTDKEGALLAYKDHDLVAKNQNISSLPIYKEKSDGNVYLDIDQVTYVSEKDDETGWQIFSVLSQEEIKSFSEQISQNMSNRIAAADKELQGIFSKLLSIQIIIVLILLVISILISLFFAKYFIGPIIKLSDFLKSVANGDLSKKMDINTKDEIGLLFHSVNHMIDSLRTMANKMNQLILEVENDSKILNDQANVSTHVTNTVSSAMDEVATGSERLAADMVNISTHVENNDLAVRSMSERISKIVDHARETKSITSVGQAAMENMNNKMNMIVSQSIESATIMKKLDSKLQTINDITSLIHDLSEQTNLLSLNASIEAARAGEQGRGFAVVAQEVKKLAEQSRQSVGEISSLISEIQMDSSKALENIDLGRESAVEGAVMTDDTAKSYSKMFGFIESLAHDIDEIASSSETLTESSHSISSSVDSVVSISQQTSAGVEEVTSITEEQKQSVHEVKKISENLRELTDELRKSIEHFKVE
ncbi:methyl-accepting chemotaxis protein [Bacillus sp. DTU_2020_1000418_1_SI_GHA_SEK_038]|uniref:methyl-accepting chemotaxis protein n=1 Tax=Bacillus sp. DTU_2020_1000418_1_SI_GHA_SEK_038 TaxID=3077585 RepID=UPI0028E67BCC|nr:methyl-accepting chemotaxis protein [Bacillus sp. DTU_2020_1000418_1_SI_GHA_SEK_038]WNS77383.1 methyl-accepting chemotaxis protein [Bacillus sp. DTU_2020_1000418_1_SI_GHA_SEK_038]